VLSQQLEQPEMTAHHLNQTELARRWRMSKRTLERWRWLGQPPRFLKIGGRVVYRLEDIEAFEAKQLRQRTPRRCKSRGSAIDPAGSQNA
jgi:hypothetical protein